MRDNNIKISDQQNNIPMTRYLICTLIMLFIAGISFYSGSIYKAKNMKIMYISQEEILALEKARILQEPTDVKQLFFDKPEEAIKQIEFIQNQKSKDGVIILLVNSKLYNRNVSSISQEVHIEIIKQLKDKYQYQYQDTKN